MHDLGDAVTITTETRDVDGTLINPAGLTIAITRPSGTLVSPTVTPDQVSTGIYRATVDVDEVGRWRYTWTASTPDGVDHGFFVVGADPPARIDPLATIADLEARIGALTDAQAARAPGLLAGASAKVRAFARHQVLTRVDDDQAVLKASGHRIRLPQRPVHDVTAVALIDGTSDLTLTDWSWDGLDEVDLRGSKLSNPASPVTPRYNSSTYRVTYSHGFDVGSPLLEAVTDVVCAMVNRVLSAPTLVEGVTQQTIGQFTQQFQQSVGSSGVGVRLYPSDKQDLIDAGIRSTSTSVKTRVR